MESSSQPDPSDDQLSVSENPVKLLDGNPQFGFLGFGKVKPAPLLVLNLKIEPEEFYLPEATQSYLGALEGECYVISVSGNPLVGKSSFLNLLLSLFNMDASQEEILYQDMYPVGDGKKSTTEGIDMYCLSRDGKNLIFLDIEGDDDPNKKETGAWIYMNLLQTAVGGKELKRDDYSVSKDTFAAKIEDYENYLGEMLDQTNLDSSLYLLPIPPLHIINKESKASCILSTGALCKDCQSDFFTTLLFDIKNKLVSHMNMKEVLPFKSGRHLSKILEQLLLINQKEIPRFSDRGYISRIRLDKFRKEQDRIQARLFEIKRYQAENGLSKKIQQTVEDHPNIVDGEFSRNFHETVMSLEIRVSQMVFLVPELSLFIQQYLLDERASILNEEEKKYLYDAYVAPFGKILKEVIASLKRYDELVESVSHHLMAIKIFLSTNSIKDWIRNLFTSPFSNPFVSFLYFTGSAVLFTYFFIEACQRQKKTLRMSKEFLNENKIDGIENVEGTEEELEKIEEFVVKRVDDFENRREILKKVCSDDGGENFNIIAKISNAMDVKVSGNNLSPEDRNQLIEKMHAAEKNLEIFKQFL